MAFKNLAGYIPYLKITNDLYVKQEYTIEDYCEFFIIKNDDGTYGIQTSD